MAQLVTDYVKVAQSGATVDGRKIDPIHLKQMAANYDKSVYTAVVFPGHDHNWTAYGTVEALQSRDEGEGIVGLYAKIDPNAFWQSDIRYGQNVFTSIEITPNFAGTGEAYLTGLGATNNPASLGVAQLSFSVADKIYSDAYETVFTEEPPKPSFFSKFKREPDMKPETAKTLQAQITELNNKFATLSKKDPDPVPAAKAEAKDDEKFSVLEQENAAFKTEIAALKEAAAKRETEFTELKTLVETFGNTLTEALKEQPGTKSFEGSGTDDSRQFV